MNEELALEVLEWIEGTAKGASSSWHVWDRIRNGGATVYERVRCSFGSSLDLGSFVEVGMMLPIHRLLALPGVTPAEVEIMKKELPLINNPPRAIVRFCADDELGEYIEVVRRRDVPAETTAELMHLLMQVVRQKGSADSPARVQLKDRVIKADEEGQ